MLERCPGQASLLSGCGMERTPRWFGTAPRVYVLGNGFGQTLGAAFDLVYNEAVLSRGG